MIACNRLVRQIHRLHVEVLTHRVQADCHDARCCAHASTTNSRTEIRVLQHVRRHLKNKNQTVINYFPTSCLFYSFYLNVFDQNRTFALSASSWRFANSGKSNGEASRGLVVRNVGSSCNATCSLVSSSSCCSSSSMQREGKRGGIEKSGVVAARHCRRIVERIFRVCWICTVGQRHAES